MQIEVNQSKRHISYKGCGLTTSTYILIFVSICFKDINLYLNLYLNLF